MTDLLFIEYYWKYSLSKQYSREKYRFNIVIPFFFFFSCVTTLSLMYFPVDNILFIIQSDSKDIARAYSYSNTCLPCSHLFVQVKKKKKTTYSPRIQKFSRNVIFLLFKFYNFIFQNFLLIIIFFFHYNPENNFFDSIFLLRKIRYT